MNIKRCGSRPLLALAVALALSLIPQAASSEGTQNMKINITVSGKTLIATVMDNPTAKDFVSLLPLTMSMEDLFKRRSSVICGKRCRRRVRGRIPRGWRHRLLVSGSRSCHLLPPGWRVDPRAWNHTDRKDQRRHGSLQRARIGEGEHCGCQINATATL